MSASPLVLSVDDQARFRELVRAASGIEVPEAREVELEQALQRSLEASSAPDLDGLYQRLAGEGGRAALAALVEALTIGETHFFRNRPQFEALADHILPELIERRRASRQLRVWSAGCASGEEAYSLAILIERLVPDLAEWQVLILATDINRQVLAKAQRGLYSTWSFREVPPDVQAGYFIPRGREFEIVPRLRERVTFAYLNLVEDSYPSLLNHTHSMDLILFRNVLIYFRPEVTRRVVARMHGALSEGGWLVVGHADNSPGMFDAFTLRNFPGTLAYKKEKEKEKEKEREKAAWAGEERWAAATHKLPPRTVWAAPQPAGGLAAEPPAGAVRAPAAEPDRYPEALGLWQRGRLDEALRLLAVVASAQPHDARAPYLAARIHANRQQLAEAEALVDEALRRAPLHARAHYLHGLILQETGRPELAVAALRRCIYADPQFVLGHFALANLLAASGQPERARKSLDNVTRWLAGRPRDELLAEGDGLTVGRLSEMIKARLI